MKLALFAMVLLLLITFSSHAANEYADGFLITKSNDTIACKILIPKDFGHFNEPALFLKVTVVDSAGNKKKYTPNDINGYTFVYQQKLYSYTSLQVEDDGKKMFAWPLSIGKRVNGYYYYSYNSTNLDKGSMGSRAEVYVLQDAETKETASIRKGGSLTDNYKTQLRRFFENDKRVLTLLVKDVKEFHDIPAFVKDANN